MSGGDPLLIFLAGGATGVFGAVVAEIAASRRQARQLRHELRLEARKIAEREIEEGVDLMFRVLDALFRLRLKLREGPCEDRQAEVGAELASCAAGLAELRAHTLKLALRFGTSALIESFGSVNDRLEEMLREMGRAAAGEKAPEALSPITPLVEAMVRFSEHTREATGGLR